MFYLHILSDQRVSYEGWMTPTWMTSDRAIWSICSAAIAAFSFCTQGYLPHASGWVLRSFFLWASQHPLTAAARCWEYEGREEISQRRCWDAATSIYTYIYLLYKESDSGSENCDISFLTGPNLLTLNQCVDQRQRHEHRNLWIHITKQKKNCK